MKWMQYILGTVAVFLVMGCGGSSAPGTLTGSSEVLERSSSQTQEELLASGAIDEQTPTLGYQAYKLTYITTDEKGQKVEASGLMTVPVGLPEEITEGIGLSMVSDDHGTIFANKEAPTEKAQSGSVDTPLIFTVLAGFVTLQPDYIGFGASKDHYHPYMLKESLANATVDFIKAARTFAKEKGIHLNGQLFVTGYSEGGYAAMAAMEKIEQEGEINVTMAAPMAGPYALDYMAMGVLNSPTIGVPSFMADVGYAYAKAYDKEASEIINEPYASMLPELFSGDYTREEIDPQLTTETLGLFNGAFVEDFFGTAGTGNPENWFMQAVSENSAYLWAPQTPMALIQCEGDDVIPYELAQIAFDAMVEQGAQGLQLIPVEQMMQTQYSWFPSAVGHAECGLPAYQVAAGLFVEARQRLYHY